MIRGLATGELHFRDIWKVLTKELLVGLLIGFITGAVILTRAYFTPPGIELLPAVAIAISLCRCCYVCDSAGRPGPHVYSPPRI